MTLSPLDSGRRVIEIEAAALTQLAASLDPSFEKAVTILQQCTGRIIVAGIGKSGHVARKIAATLASTGTPAQFVHPTEASHGDMGMITERDVVVALSNSGETAELADLIAYTKRYHIPLIGITSGAQSALASAATIVLVLPAAPEACPMGMAPTTSTTLMLALGDALAVALLEQRGFTRDEYRVLHPGGKLGARLKRVGDLMHEGTALPIVASHTPMSDALVLMTEKGFGCCGVVDGQQTLMGVITDGDLRRHMGPHLFTARVDDIMTRSPKTILPDALAAEALGIMNAKNITSLFAVDAGGIVRGIVHIHDCLRAGVE